MASSEVSEVFTSPFADERTLNQIASENVIDDTNLNVVSKFENDDIYGTDELIVSSEDVPQSAEEIVGSSITDSLSDVYVPTSVMTSSPTIDLIKKSSILSPSRKPNRAKRKNGGLESLFNHGGDEKETTWQQKRVSIKTLEGEFSVTMWASGAEDDGKGSKKKLFLYPRV